MRLLVVIAGPIAAGKSTLAEELATRVAGPGTSAVVVDLDDVAGSQRSSADASELWRRAAAVAGASVRAWFDNGADVVVAHGPFFESGGYALLLDGMPRGVVVRHVLLRVTIEEALVRVAADAGRGRSKDPGFLRSAHERFRLIEPTLPRPDLVFETATRAAREIAEEITARLPELPSADPS